MVRPGILWSRIARSVSDYIHGSDLDRNPAWSGREPAELSGARNASMAGQAGRTKLIINNPGQSLGDLRVESATQFFERVLEFKRTHLEQDMEGLYVEGFFDAFGLVSSGYTGANYFLGDEEAFAAGGAALMSFGSIASGAATAWSFYKRLEATRLLQAISDFAHYETNPATGHKKKRAPGDTEKIFFAALPIVRVEASIPNEDGMGTGDDMVTFKPEKVTLNNRLPQGLMDIINEAEHHKPKLEAFSLSHLPGLIRRETPKMLRSVFVEGSVTAYRSFWHEPRQTLKETAASLSTAFRLAGNPVKTCRRAFLQTAEERRIAFHRSVQREDNKLISDIDREAAKSLPDHKKLRLEDIFPQEEVDAIREWSYPKASLRRLVREEAILAAGGVAAMLFTVGGLAKGSAGAMSGGAKALNGDFSGIGSLSLGIMDIYMAIMNVVPWRVIGRGVLELEGKEKEHGDEIIRKYSDLRELQARIKQTMDNGGGAATAEQESPAPAPAPA